MTTLTKLRSAIVAGIHSVARGHSGTAATVQTLLARLFILASNVATGIVTARALGPIGRGEQAAMILWPQFLAYAMTLGLPSALLYNLKRYPEERSSELFSAALLLGTVLGLVASLIGIISMPQWLSQYPLEVIQTAQWFMLTAPLALLGLIFTATLEAYGDFTTANQMRFLQPLATLVILSILALAHLLTPFTAGIAYVLPGLPVFFWILAHVCNLFHLSWQGLGESYKLLLSYGLRSYGIDLLNTLSLQVDQVLVVGLLSPASMGIYVVALSISRILHVFQGSIVTVLFPKVVARPVAEVVALTGRVTRLSTTLTLLVATVIMLLGPAFLHLFYGPEFMQAVTVFRILLIEVVLGGTAWVLAQAFMALGRPGVVTALQGVSLGLSVPLMLVLIPMYGLTGAGIALLCSTTARLAFILVSFPLVLKVRPPSLLITQEDWCFLQSRFKSRER